MLYFNNCWIFLHSRLYGLVRLVPSPNLWVFPFLPLPFSPILKHIYVIMSRPSALLFVMLSMVSFTSSNKIVLLSSLLFLRYILLLCFTILKNHSIKSKKDFSVFNTCAISFVILFFISNGRNVIVYRLTSDSAFIFSILGMKTFLTN